MNDRIENDYLLFMNASMDASVERGVFSHILAKLNPSTMKVVCTHTTLLFLAGLATLLVCPQFGMGGVIFGHEFIHFFLSFGQVACGIFCSSIFFAITMTFNYFLLPLAYKRKLQIHAGSIGLFVPAVLMGLMMLTSAVAGQLVVMGLAFAVSWYLSGVLLHFGFTKYGNIYA